MRHVLGYARLYLHQLLQAISSGLVERDMSSMITLPSKPDDVYSPELPLWASCLMPCCAGPTNTFCGSVVILHSVSYLI